MGIGKYVLIVDMLKGLTNVAFRVWEEYSEYRHAESWDLFCQVPASFHHRPTRPKGPGALSHVRAKGLGFRVSSGHAGFWNPAQKAQLIATTTTGQQCP